MAGVTTTLQRIAEHYGTAMVATAGSSKGALMALAKGAERRDVIIGSSAWSRTGGSVFTLTSEGHDGTKNTRRLVVQHRNAATERYLLRLVGGRLEAVDEATAEMISEHENVIDWLYGREAPFTANQFRTALKMSGATSRTWLLTLVTDGCLSTQMKENSEYVYYKVNFANLEKWQKTRTGQKSDTGQKVDT